MPTLTVKVVGVKGAPEGKNYFVKVSVGEGKGQKTSKSSTKTTDPTFTDPAFSLTVDNPDTDVVTFVLFQTTLPAEKKIGSASLSLKDLIKGEDTAKTIKADKGFEFSVSVKAEDFGKGKAKKKKKETSSPRAEAAEGSHLPPIPPTERLESLFAQLLEELAMPAEVAAGMKAFPPMRKWELICQRRLVERERETSSTSLEQKPEYWVSALKADAGIDLLTPLGLRLGHELVGWLKDFANLGGITQMTTMLSDLITKKKKQEQQLAAEKELIVCFSKLLNNKAGMDLVIQTDKALKTLLLVFSDFEADDVSKALVAKLLSVVALSNEGHIGVLEAFSNFKEVTGEKTRFRTITRVLKETEDIELKTTVLTLLNAVTNAPEDLDERTSIRQELLDAGLERTLDKLREIDSTELELQISIFDEEQEHDSEVLKKRFAHVADLRLEDINAVFSALQELSKQTGVQSYFKDILTNLVSLKPENEFVKQQWVSAAKIIRQLSNQKKLVGDVSFQQLMHSVSAEVRDVLPLKQRIEELEEEVSQHTKELKTKQIEFKEKADELEKLKEELATAKSSLTASEQATQSLTSKISELETDLKGRQTEIVGLQQKVKDAEAKAVAAESKAATTNATATATHAADQKLHQQVTQLSHEVDRLKKELDSAKAQAQAAQAAAHAAPPPPPPPPGADGGAPPPPPPPPGADGGPPPPPPPPGGDFGGPPPPPPPPGVAGGPPPPPPPPGGDGGPPPPPPPPGGAGGPPPPPPPPGAGGPPPPPPGPGGPPPPPGMGPPPPGPPGLKMGGAPKKRPEIKPSQKVRGLQWSKLVAGKVNGTFFGALPMELDGFKLDFDAIESRFAQVTKTPTAAEGGADAPKKKEGPVTILDPKTGQNLAIFLNGFKNYKYSQVAEAIANMDESILNSQQVQSLITLLPPAEELANVKEYLSNGGEKEKLGPAEQFALEVAEVPSVLARLKAFNYKTTFSSRKSDIKPDIDSVTTACQQVQNSKKLSKVLEIVLHIGNFLNAGTNNGQAFGFKLNTLQKLGDAKTTDNKSNLLTVIVEMIEEKNKDLLDFARELDSIESAVRVNMGVLQGELTKLTRDFDTVVKKSLETVEKSGDNDQFHQKITDFIALAESDLAKMNEDYKKMEQDYESVVKFFAEDPKSMGPDEFFAFFKNFVDSVADCRKKLEQARLAAEKEAKRAQAKVAGAAGKKVGPPMPAGAKKLPFGVPAGAKKVGQAAVVDELFGQLQAKNVFKAKREGTETEEPSQ